MVRCGWCFPDKLCISQLFTYDHGWYKNLHLTLEFQFQGHSSNSDILNIFFVSFKCVCYSSFIGEESVAAGEGSILTDNPTWIIDPIDGTTNFVHRSTFHFLLCQQLTWLPFFFLQFHKSKVFSLLNYFKKRDTMNLLIVTDCIY